ncbi:PLP-dependent aminotransferase family protein [Undibacterium sp. SXout11W]|uniref:MocR-like pyridoxine biosynthesis transcription factor PdxR n=1 Tax=Undibacterium sp. SXout11W TaxID=3413050 RepID=UPI003BF1C86A
MDYALLLTDFSKNHCGWSQQRLLHECLRSAIKTGKLNSGTRMLATRQLASDLGIARNTVLYAYEQLATEGYVRSDRRGTFVADIKLAKVRDEHVSQLLHPGLSQRAQVMPSRQPETSLTTAFTPGIPSLVDFPIHLWRRLLERAWRSTTATQLSYGDAAGEPLLREAIADHLRASRGVICEPSQVFITDGTQSSLDLCAHAFADKGDVVWMESPGYRGALNAFHAAELRIHPIAVDLDGIAPSVDDWHKSSPKLIYVTPSHQFPLGGVLTLERRIALIEQARTAGALLIEDDYDSEFRYDGPPLPAMQGLMPNAPVIYLGTFSKTMFPALRIGFMIVPQGFVAAINDLVSQSVSRGRTTDQLALADFLSSGQFATHLRRMRRLYRQRRDCMKAALERHTSAFGKVYGISSGMHLVLALDESISDMKVSANALEQGIVAHAVSAHVIGEVNAIRNGLVLGYAQVPIEQIDEAVRKLSEIIKSAKSF